ncbi:MAG TPA: glycosyltransferase family 39 protein [Planctomycetota bacterium]|nr:glycosyltransferase family 39 protein [Planctomycetota bacterium]
MSESESPARSSDSAARWILLGALGIGLVRFWRLARWSLWFDEVVTWTDYHHSLENPEIGNPLGYRAIAWTVARLGGVPDEFALRFLPALAGWLAIPLAYWAFRARAGRLRASCAALLLAASSWQVYWSQNARFYTLAQAVALLGAGLLVRGLWRRQVALTVLGFAVTAGAASLHPSAALLLPAFVLAPFLLRLLARKSDALPDVRAGAALLVLLAVVLVLRFDWAWRAIGNYIGQKPQSNPAHFILTTGFYVTPLLATGAFVGVLLAIARRDTFHLFAALVLAIVLGSALVVSLVARVSAQYVFVALPWFALLACVPLADAEPVAGRTAGALRAAWLAVLVLPALSNVVLYFTVRQGERPAWRDAYEFVWNRREPDDLVLGMEATVGEYYLNPLRTELRHTVRVAWLDRYRAHEPERWAAHARRTWYVLNPEQLLDWNPDDAAAMRRFLAEECRLVACYPLYVESRDLSVWVYLRG